MSPLAGSTAGATDIADVAPVAAALLAQLQRLQQQLSECVNCATAQTPQGKAAIDAIRGKISQVEQRIAHSDQAGERRQALLATGKTEPAASLASSAGSVSQAAKSSPLGRTIDLFA